MLIDPYKQIFYLYLAHVIDNIPTKSLRMNHAESKNDCATTLGQTPEKPT